MPDPGINFESRSSDPNGRGPFEFESPEMEPSDTWVIDFRELDKGRYLIDNEEGFDNSEIVNLNNQSAVKVTRNDVASKTVPPNTIRSFENPGQYRFEVENISGSEIEAGGVKLNVSKSAYGADQQARDSSNRGPIERVINNFTGL